MADVAYNTSSFPALLSTLASLLALSDHDGNAAAGARESLVLLAYKERDPGERQLWDMMMADVGVALEQVGRRWRRARASWQRGWRGRSSCRDLDGEKNMTDDFAESMVD